MVKPFRTPLKTGEGRKETLPLVVSFSPASQIVWNFPSKDTIYVEKPEDFPTPINIKWRKI